MSESSGDVISRALTVLQEAFAEAKNRDSRLVFLIVRDEPEMCCIGFNESDKSANRYGINEIVEVLTSEQTWPLTMKQT